MRVNTNTTAISASTACTTSFDGQDDDRKQLYADVARILDRAQIEPGDYPTQLVELSRMWEWHWKMAKQAGGVAVHRVYPCPACQRPVACLQLVYADAYVIVDAEESLPDFPDWWYANLFQSHRCGGGSEVRQ